VTEKYGKRGDGARKKNAPWKTTFGRRSSKVPANYIEMTQEPMQEMSETFLEANKNRADRDRPVTLWGILRDGLSLFRRRK